MQFLEELRKILTYKIKNTIEIDDDNAAKSIAFLIQKNQEYRLKLSQTMFESDPA